MRLRKLFIVSGVLGGALTVLIAILWNQESVRYPLEPLVHQAELTLLGKQYAPLSVKHAGRWISRNDFGNYLYQRRAAADHGLPLIEDQATHDALVTQGALVRLPVRGDGYRINTPELRHSSPYFSRTMVDAFTDMTERWAGRMRAAGFKSPRVLVNSGTRTVPQQKRIAELHSGATRRISAHSYGAALDLKRIEYRGRHGQKARDEARALLKEVLDESEAFFWVPEGSNFHITAKPGR